MADQDWLLFDVLECICRQLRVFDIICLASASKHLRNLLLVNPALWKRLVLGSSFCLPITLVSVFLGRLSLYFYIISILTLFEFSAEWAPAPSLPVGYIEYVKDRRAMRYLNIISSLDNLPLAPVSQPWFDLAWDYHFLHQNAIARLQGTSAQQTVERSIVAEMSRRYPMFDCRGSEDLQYDSYWMVSWDDPPPDLENPDRSFPRFRFFDFSLILARREWTAQYEPLFSYSCSSMEERNQKSTASVRSERRSGSLGSPGPERNTNHNHVLV